MIRILVLTLLAGCGRSALTDHLAVGWTGAEPTSRGPCKREAMGAATAVQDTGYNTLLAVAPGELTFDCRDGKVTLVVMQPTALTIQPPQRVTRGAPLTLSVAAAAGGQNLALGDAAVGWTLPAGVRQTEACSQGACIKPSSVRVIADAAGTYVINAQFGALTATTTIVVN